MAIPIRRLTKSLGICGDLSLGEQLFENQRIDPAGNLTAPVRVGQAGSFFDEGKVVGCMERLGL